MKSLEKLSSAFCSAWDMMIDIPLPGRRDETYSDYSDSFLTAAMIPVVGMVPGIILCALGVLVVKSVAACAVWAVFAVLVSELVNSGRGVKLMAEHLAKAIYKESYGTFVNTLVMFIMLFKLAAFFCLAYNLGAKFALLIFVLIFTFEMYGVIFPERNAMLELDEHEKKMAYVIPAAAAFVYFWRFPVLTLVSIAAVWGIIMILRRKVWSDSHKVTADEITLFAEYTEVVLLFLVIIFQGAI